MALLAWATELPHRQNNMPSSRPLNLLSTNTNQPEDFSLRCDQELKQHPYNNTMFLVLPHDLKKEVNDLEQQMHQECQQFSKEKDQIQAQYIKKQEDISQQKQVIMDRLTSKRELLQRKKQRISEIENKFKQYNIKRKEQYQQLIEKIKSNREQKRKQLKEIENQLSITRRKKTILRSSVLERQQRITNIKGEIDRLTKDRNNMIQVKKDNNARIMQNKKERDNIKQVYQEYKAKYNKKTQEDRKIYEQNVDPYEQNKKDSLQKIIQVRGKIRDEQNEKGKSAMGTSDGNNNIWITQNIDEEQAKIDKYQQDVKDKKDQIPAENEKYTQYKEKRNKQLQEDIKENKAKYKQLTNDINRAKEKRNNIQKSLQGLKTARSKKVDSNKRNDQTIYITQQKVNYLENKKQQLEQQLNKGNKGTLRRLTQKRKNQKGSIQDQLDKVTKDLNEIQGKLKRLHKEQDEFRSAKKDLNNKIEEITKEIKGWREEKQLIQQYIEKRTKEKQKDINDAIKNKNNAIAQIRGDIAKIENNIQYSHNQIKQYEKQLQQEIGQQTADKNNEITLIQQYHQEIQQLREGIEQEEQKIQYVYKKYMDEETRRNTEYKAKDKEVKEQTEKLNKEITELKKQRDLVIQQQKDLLGKIRGLVKSKSQLEQEQKDQEQDDHKEIQQEELNKWNMEQDILLVDRQMESEEQAYSQEQQQYDQQYTQQISQESKGLKEIDDQNKLLAKEKEQQDRQEEEIIMDHKDNQQQLSNTWANKKNIYSSQIDQIIKQQEPMAQSTTQQQYSSLQLCQIKDCAECYSQYQCNKCMPNYQLHNNYCRLVITPSLSFQDSSHFQVQFSSELRGMDQQSCNIKASFKDIPPDHYSIQYSCTSLNTIHLYVTYEYKILEPILEVTLLKTESTVYEWVLSKHTLIKIIPADKQESQEQNQRNQKIQNRAKGMVRAQQVMLANTFLLNSLGLMWQLIDSIQLISCLIFLDVALPAQLNMFYQALLSANYDFIPNPFKKITSFYNNMAENIIKSIVGHENKVFAPIQFIENGYNSFFVLNQSFALAAILFLALLLWCILRIMSPQPNTPLFKAQQYCLSQLQYDFFYLSLQTMMISITISMFLQFRIINQCWDTFQQVMSQCLAICMAIFIIAFHVFYFKTINQNYQQEDQEQQDKYKLFETVQEDLDHNRVWARNVHFLYMSRKLIILAILVFSRRADIQIPVIWAVYVLSFFYFLLVKPNKESKVINLISISDHVLFIVILSFVWRIQSIQQGRKEISWEEDGLIQDYSVIVILSSVLLILINFVYVLVVTLQQLYENRHKYKEFIIKFIQILKGILFKISGQSKNRVVMQQVSDEDTQPDLEIQVKEKEEKKEEEVLLVQNVDQAIDKHKTDQSLLTTAQIGIVSMTRAAIIARRLKKQFLKRKAN